MSKVRWMDAVFGIPLTTWDTPISRLLEEKSLTDDLLESDEDSYLPYFVTRTVSHGIHEGTLADIALMLWTNDLDFLGFRTYMYARRAFELASGIAFPDSLECAKEEFAKLRELAD